MKFIIVDDKHPITRGLAVAAYDGPKLAGFVRVFVGDYLSIAAGTWVAPSHRRQGLALALWRRVMQRARIIEVVPCIKGPCTKGGRALAKKLAKLYEGQIVLWD